jgi:HTH-type transcriptional regulator / antitoxin HigA
MKIKPIHNEEQYELYLSKIEELMDANPQQGTDEADLLEVLSVLTEKYEEQVYPISEPDPIDAILFRMEQLGMSRNDLKPYIGDTGRISEVLNRRRNLSISMIRRLHENLNIPYESLMKETRRKTA